MLPTSSFTTAVTSRLRSQRALTLVELIIAMTLFLSLITAGMVATSNFSKSSKKIEMIEYLNNEGQALLERLTREIQASGIDYEEYYSHEVIQGGLSTATFGENYGEYHKQFFEPGTGGGPESTGHGAWCATPPAPRPPGNTYEPGECAPDPTSFDYEVGIHPNITTTAPPERANALCEELGSTSDCTSNLSYHQMDELFLISKTGEERIFFAIENNNDGVNALSMVELASTGDNDGNGIADGWECATEYVCTGGTSNNLPLPSDLTDLNRNNTNFTPISPVNLHVESLKFYLSPIEDPFKGYNETTSDVFESVQLQPRVTIVMTLKYQLYDGNGEPIDFTRTNDYLGEAPEVTFQTTINTGVNTEIPAYSFP